MRRLGVSAIYPGKNLSKKGSQFTSGCFINVLEENNIEISMDGKDRALDNIRIERLLRSIRLLSSAQRPVNYRFNADIAATPQCQR